MASATPTTFASFQELYNHLTSLLSTQGPYSDEVIRVLTTAREKFSKQEYATAYHAVLGARVLNPRTDPGPPLPPPPEEPAAAAGRGTFGIVGVVLGAVVTFVAAYWPQISPYLATLAARIQVPT